MHNILIPVWFDSPLSVIVSSFPSAIAFTRSTIPHGRPVKAPAAIPSIAHQSPLTPHLPLREVPVKNLPGGLPDAICRARQPYSQCNQRAEGSRRSGRRSSPTHSGDSQRKTKEGRTQPRVLPKLIQIAEDRYPRSTE